MSVPHTNMFFRRERVIEPTFDDRLAGLKKTGFAVERKGVDRARVMRDGVGAVIEVAAGTKPRVVERAGVLIGDSIGTLVDGGFQKFFRTPDGKLRPAQAHELKAVHAFQEDLREALGLISLYNEAMGTVSNQYLYDRVKDRDKGAAKRIWE